MAAGLLLGAPARAQEGAIIQPGFMAVTGFPGTVIPGFEEGLLPGVDPVDETFIDVQRASLRIFDMTFLGGPPTGQVVFTPPPFEVPAGEIGQVFGLAYDDGKREDTTAIAPSLYAAATSFHGVEIVTDDEDEDGRPERQRRGTAGARFMDGQFGEKNGGGPGSIWKIDGITGAVSLFADIETNSGPGIGNLAFDRSHRQFFASDLDSGLIHRIGIDGNLVDTFDHGVEGRPAHGLDPLADDGAVMDIAGAAFDAEEPKTWGYTQAERRVYGLAVHGGRLYYAVGEEAEIWSVGIARDGTFAGDPRWELTVEAEEELPVTDIAFDTRGFMYLAQRGEVENRYDYSSFADSGEAEVLRYWRESPDDPETESIWVPAPEEYAVGFPQPHRQAAGGIDLQYGYDNQGLINRNACSDTLAKTGDRLRDNPALEDQLAEGGPLAVHGVQLTASFLVRPQNEPPFGSWFADFDGFFDDPEVKGHVGDVEVWRPCEGRAGYYEPIPYPGDYPVPGWPPGFPPPGDLPPCIEVEAAEYFCTPAGLEADLYIRDRAGIGGDSLHAKSLTPGVGVFPPKQTVPSLATPFTLGVSGHLPGETVDLGLCFYRDADAQAGGYFPCCKVTLPLETPLESCEP
ncbi:hypothetical protein NUU27_24255 [Nitratireductor sp. ZSWI3]|nr:hypothetical protein [Nitratireductor sp. ZSWI3]MCR4269303.1 hypothetical protein [Nitratireductor sp. ZSWI3]